MGRVTIQQDQGAGKYLVQVVYDTRRVDLRITKLQAEIAELDQADQGPIWKALNVLLDKQAELNAVKAEMNQYLADIINADPWQASKEYVLNARIRINAFLLARCALAGISGTTRPTFPESGSVRENAVTWQTFDSALALGHPFWQRNTNYTINDQIFTGYSPSAGLSRYATAQSTGRSGPGEPDWTLATVADGGIIWVMEPKAEKLTQLAAGATEVGANVAKAQLEYDRLTSRLSELQKELATVQAWIPDTTAVAAWCHDYTEGLTNEVSSAEINGERPAGLNVRAASVPHQNALTLHNDHRATLDPPAPPLYPDYRLYEAAQRIADDANANNFLSHQGSDGSWPYDRMIDAGFDWQRADLGDVLGVSLIKGLPEWAADTEYNIGDRIKLETTQSEATGQYSEFFFHYAIVKTKGKSGSSKPTFVLSNGATVKENFIIWTTSDSAIDLGHPDWAAQTDYAVDDEVKTSFSLPAGQIRYAKATQAGRSGSEQPDWTSSPVDDGGVLWETVQITRKGTYGENGARGFQGWQAAFDSWLASPGHLRNIENPLYTKVGFGYSEVFDNTATFPNNRRTMYFVVFGALDTSLGLYEPGLDGLLQPTVSGTAASVFYNLALLPGWQKWMPTYRIGTLLEVDRITNTGTVLLDLAFSYWAEALAENEVEIDSLGGNLPNTANVGTEETRNFRLLENITFRYMTCDHLAFCSGDKVVVEYAGQNVDYPYIVGFPDNPRPCGIRLHLVRDDNRVIRPDEDIWVDFTIYIFDYNATTGDFEIQDIGSGGWAGTDTDPPPIDPGFRQGVSYDTENDCWILKIYPFVDNLGRRPTGPVWLEVDMLDTIPSGVQYPRNYRSADKFLSINQITTFCEKLEMRLPYWRVVTNDEDRVFDDINDCHVTASATVYASVTYEITHTWLNTFALDTNINATSTFVGAFVNSYPDGQVTVYGDGATLVQSGVASPPTTFAHVVEGTQNTGPVSGIIGGRAHETTLIHDNLTASFGGDPWSYSLTLKAEHELGISGIFVFDTQVFVGFVYDY